jgi:hypothetical protein
MKMMRKMRSPRKEKLFNEVKEEEAYTTEGDLDKDVKLGPFAPLPRQLVELWGVSLEARRAYGMGWRAPIKYGT